MSQPAKVVVVMPAYNAEKYVASTFNTIVAQTSNEWEAIVMDGGSKDKTVEIDLKAKKYFSEKSYNDYLIKGGLPGVFSIRDAAIRKEVGQHAAFYFIRWAHVAEAPLIIALCGDSGNRAYHRYLHEDVGLAGAQIMLQATALGLGSCWVGGLDRPAIAAILKLPENVELVGLLTIGFPAEEPPPPVRKPLTDLIHYEVYGNRRSDVAATPGRVPGGVLSIALRRLRLPVRF